MSSQENLFRSLKRNPHKRYNPIIKNDQLIGSDYIPTLSQTALFKTMKEEVGHVAMKKESKELRRIMSSTGLNEKEVRDRLTYQKSLNLVADNSDVKGLHSYEKKFLKISRQVMKEKGLPIWNESVIEAIKNVVKESIEDNISKNPYMTIVYEDQYCENVYDDFNSYVLKGLKSGIDEVKIWHYIIDQNRNNFLKRYILLSKKKRNK